MGSELNQPEWPPNAPRPKETPPEGVILTEMGADGRTRRILYRASMGKKKEIVISESAGRPRGLVQSGTQPVSVPLMRDQGPAMGIMNSPFARAFEQPPVPVAIPVAHLGQAAPPTEEPPCPTSIEMPDGRVIGPEDAVTARDLCEILRSFAEQSGLSEAARKFAPGMQVPVVGQVPGPAGVPTTQIFGPGAGPAGGVGGGGGAFIGGGGGGPGPVGPQGAAGPTGQGFVVDFVVKTDGDFEAGPGAAFIPVPGTLVSFTQGSSGPVIAQVQIVFGGAFGTSQSGQIGLRVDGVDQPLTARLIHTFAGGVGEFLIGQATLFPFDLAAGSHTIQLVARGLEFAEFGGGGLGIPLSIRATAQIPLAVIIQHR